MNSKAKEIIAYRIDNSLENSADNAMFNAYQIVLDEGTDSDDRTGTGTLRKQHAYFVWDAANVFPALKAKKVTPQTALIEALWMLKGDTNVEFLKQNKVNIWNEWADENGNLGKVYGYQMRYQDGIDQIQVALDTILNNPNSRRIIVDLWHAKDLPEMKLPPCHCFYNFQVTENELHSHKEKVDYTINLHVTQRSADSFLGVPYDKMLFTFIMHIMYLYIKLHSHYKKFDRQYFIGDIHYTCNDFHIYLNHLDQVEKYCSNYSEDPLELFKPDTYKAPNELAIMPQALSILMNAFESTHKVNGTSDYPLSFDQYLHLLINVIGIENIFSIPDLNGNYPFIKAKVAV